MCDANEALGARDRDRHTATKTMPNKDKQIK
jgi:hypothetical protein